MRLTAVVTLLCALVAFILSILCLFAGSNRTFLQDADMLTLNISRIGHTTLFNTTDGDGGFFDTLINDIQEGINDLVNDVTSDIAEALNLPDFYRVHVMDFCQGIYYPNASLDDPEARTTRCSNRTTFFHFEPSKTVEEALPSGITLEDLHWPSEIRTAERSIKVATNAMFVCYVIGIAFAGVGIFTAIWAIISGGRLSALVNLVVDLIAFLGLGIASAIATAVIVKGANTINKYGERIGIAAYKGSKFLGMTWAATALIFVAAIISVAQAIGGRKRDKHVGEKDRP
ncbi:hypothetical protein B0A52_05121 [Exophiala mesophila]|uniref:Actin cortical patch SUR7/pH-response regulator PalI n=1 Tax=Exophiala mesophila TaxID=212818 RepID=A0A438N715_EXOME|nr:hypothetical protein B0A52_05121 [Exophiala mesophila]